MTGHGFDMIKGCREWMNGGCGRDRLWLWLKKVCNLCVVKGF